MSTRNTEFLGAIETPHYFTDSRFGLRKLFLNENEKPSIAVYGTPGKGANGESSS